MQEIRTGQHGRGRTPLALIIVAGLLAACADADPAPTAQIRRVMVETVAAAQVQATEVVLPGRVASPRASQLAFEVQGRLQTLVSEGERVDEGATLARLDRTDYALQVREATAQVRMLEADVSRKRRLRDGGVLSAAALDPVVAQLESARVALATAQRQLSHTTLNAPFAGRVARRLASERAVVPAGEPVLVLQQDDVVDVQVDLPEWTAQRLPLGPGLTGTAEPPGGGTPLALAYLEHGTQPDEGARTYPLILRGDQPDAMNLLPGMAVRVRLSMPAPPAAPEAASPWIVPLHAIARDRDDTAYVWLLDDEDHVQRVDVAVGQVDGERAQVDGELHEGARVVVAGVGRLHPGQAVQPQARN